MLSYAEYQEVLQMRRELAALRADLDRTVRDYYARKFSPDQPRVPAGSREGGQWTGDGGDNGETADVKEILAKAKQLAASHASVGKCVDACRHLLEKP